MTIGTCAVQKVRGLIRELKERALFRDDANIGPFMSWVFSLPHVTLKDGVMEDPHDLLVPLWQLMTMAGGININGRSYTLSSFIEHRALGSLSFSSADSGHYVAYVRLSEDGTVWKVANDGDEQR